MKDRIHVDETIGVCVVSGLQRAPNDLKRETRQQKQYNKINIQIDYVI